MIANTSPTSRPVYEAAHGLHLAPYHHPGAARQTTPSLIDELVDVPGNSSQVSPLHRAIDVNDRRDIVVRDLSHAGPLLHGYQAGHQGWRGCGIRPRHGNIHQILQRVLAILRSLNSDRVADPGPRIYPERRRSLKAAAEGYQQILCDVVGRESQLLCFRSLNSEVQIRLVERLLNSQISRPRNVANLL